MREYPGWLGADGKGPPVQIRPATPDEERDLYLRSPEEHRQKVAEMCAVDPRLPRKQRRIAVLAWEKAQKKAGRR